MCAYKTSSKELCSHQQGNHYWRWVARARHTVLIVTHTPPREPRIEFRPEAVALFKYPNRCLTRKCQGHPHRGPLYIALHTLGVLRSELGPVL